MVLVATLPVVLLLFLMYWVGGSLDAKSARIKALDNQIGEQQLLEQARRNAAERRSEYRAASLSSVEEIQQDYGFWLNDLAEAELSNVTFNANKSGALGSNNQKAGAVATKHSFSIIATGTLPQLTSFLYKFHYPNILHRITTLSIIPKSRAQGNEQVRTGELDLRINVEALSLTDADVDKMLAIDEPSNRLNKSFEEYAQSIVRRNIFGPPNNPPKLSVRDQSKFVDEEIAIMVRANDDDEADQLDFKLIKSDVPEAKLGAKQSADAKAVEFTLPGMPEGSYKFTVQVTDDGCPAKVDVQEFVVDVKEKPVVVRDDKKEDLPPPFKHIGESKITAIVQGANKPAEVWINVRTKGDFLRLHEGDTFDLDQVEWLVREIDLDMKEVVMMCDGKEMTFKRGDFLSEPRHVTEVVSDRVETIARGETDDN